MQILKSTVFLIGLAGAVFSQQQTQGVSGSDAIAARQAGMDMSSITLRSIVDAVKAGREVKSLGYSAAALSKWSKAVPGLFPPGSGEGETAAMSQALPAIWRDRAGFDRVAANYAAATEKLAALAAANDMEGFTKQLDAVNQACNACHGRSKGGAQGPPAK